MRVSAGREIHKSLRWGNKGKGHIEDLCVSNSNLITNRKHIQNVGKYLDIVKNKWFSEVEDMQL